MARNLNVFFLERTEVVTLKRAHKSNCHFSRERTLFWEIYYIPVTCAGFFLIIGEFHLQTD